MVYRCFKFTNWEKCHESVIILILVVNAHCIQIKYSITTIYVLNFIAESFNGHEMNAVKVAFNPHPLFIQRYYHFIFSVYI